MSDEQAELAAAHARIAALEARQAQAVEMLEVVLGATLPYQDESGVIRVKLHPFGKIRNAATLLSSASGGEGPTALDIAKDEINRAMVSAGLIDPDDYDGPLSLHQCAEIIASSPTPAPAEDVVERVGRAIYVSMGLGDAWDSAPECVRDKWKVHARAALSALPLDREGIREIRERHAAVENREPEFAWMHQPMDSNGYPYGPAKEVNAYLPIDGEQAHEDRAFLLQQITNLGDENGD